MSANLDWIEMYVTPSKKWNHNKCRCERKELDDCGSCEIGYMGYPSTCVCECNKAWKIDEYLDIKNCTCEKSLIGKLVLKYEDEILNTIETLLNNEKLACAKSSFLFILFHGQCYVSYYLLSFALVFVFITKNIYKSSRFTTSALN